MKLQNTSIKKKSRATPGNSAAVVKDRSSRLSRGLGLELVGLVSDFLPTGVRRTPVVLAVLLEDDVASDGGAVALANDLGAGTVVAGADDLNLHRISPLRLGCAVPRLPVAGIPKTNLKDALIIADCGQSVKPTECVGFRDRKSPYFRAFSGTSYWIKNFSSPQFKTSARTMFCEIANSVLSRKYNTREPPSNARRRALTCNFLSGAPARNRTSNNGLEVRSYIHLTTGAMQHSYTTE